MHRDCVTVAARDVLFYDVYNVMPGRTVSRVKRATTSRMDDVLVCMTVCFNEVVLMIIRQEKCSPGSIFLCLLGKNVI